MLDVKETFVEGSVGFKFIGRREGEEWICSDRHGYWSVPVIYDGSKFKSSQGLQEALSVDTHLRD